MEKSKRRLRKTGNSVALWAKALLPCQLVLLGGCVMDVKVRQPVLALAPLNDQTPLSLRVIGTEKFDRTEKELGLMCGAQDYQIRYSNSARRAIEVAFSSRFPAITAAANSTTGRDQVTVTVDEIKTKLRCPLVGSLTIICRSDTRVKLSATTTRGGSHQTFTAVGTARGVSDTGVHCSLGSEAMSKSISQSFEDALHKLVTDARLTDRSGS